VGEEKDGAEQKRQADLDELLKERDFRKRLGERLRHWATLIAAVIVAVGYTWDALSKIIRQLLEHSAK
jgi:uncharacterized membrane protein